MIKDAVLNQYSKATWPTMANALILLANSYLPAPWAMNETQQGWAMIIATGLVAYFVPAPGYTAPGAKPAPADDAESGI